MSVHSILMLINFIAGNTSGQDNGIQNMIVKLVMTLVDIMLILLNALVSLSVRLVYGAVARQKTLYLVC